MRRKRNRTSNSELQAYKIGEWTPAWPRRGEKANGDWGGSGDSIMRKKALPAAGGGFRRKTLWEEGVVGELDSLSKRREDWPRKVECCSVVDRRHFSDPSALFRGAQLSPGGCGVRKNSGIDSSLEKRRGLYAVGILRKGFKKRYPSCTWSGEP